MAKRRWVWVSRCDDEACDVLHIYTRYRPKPTMNPEGLYEGSEVDPCSGAMQTFTGLTLGPGECCKVEFTAKKVK